MLLAVLSLPALAAVGAPEQEEIKLGFIKLTDMAPLAVAYERGYFEDEGLYVTLEAQANWKILLDRVIDGELDGAQMLAGQPLAAHIGIGTQAELVTAFAMDLNGNAITVAKPVWAAMAAQLPKPVAGKVPAPVSAAALKPVVEQYRQAGKPFNMGMVFPVSPQLRAQVLACGWRPQPRFLRTQARGQLGPAPGGRAAVSHPATADARHPGGGHHRRLQRGEPWNQQALAKGIGVPVITDQEIWRNNPEKVFGVTREWAERHPNTHVRLVKALLRAAWWLDAEQNGNRREAAKMLARPEYVGPTSR